MRSSSVPVVRLWTAVLLGYLALGATLQELPTYVSRRFDAGPFVVGLVVALAFAGTALGRPFAGRLGDLGQARRTAAGGAALAALAAVGHLVAPDLGWLLAARVLMGLGEAGLFSGVLPWVLSAMEPSRAGRVAGWFGLSMWGGLSLGPLIAVAVPASTTVWATVIALPAVSCVLILTARRPGSRRQVEPSAPHHRTRVLMPAGVTRPALVLALAAYGYGTLTALLVLFLRSSDVGGAGLGLVVFSAAFLVTRAAGSPLVDRLGASRVTRVVVLVEAAGFALLAAASSPAVALIAVSVVGVGLGVIYPATSKLVLSSTPRAHAGAAMGAMTSCWDLGILVAGPVGGLVATGPGYRAAFVLAGLTAVAAFAVELTRSAPRPTTPAAVAPQPDCPHAAHATRP